MNIISAKQAMILAKNLTRPNDVTPDKLSQLFRLILHFQGVGKPNQTEYELLHNILQTNKFGMLNLTNILKPKCTDLIQGCRWKGYVVRCDTIFQPINTVDGICCSFNSYATATTNFHP